MMVVRFATGQSFVSITTAALAAEPPIALAVSPTFVRLLPPPRMRQSCEGTLRRLLLRPDRAATTSDRRRGRDRVEASPLTRVEGRGGVVPRFQRPRRSRPNVPAGATGTRPCSPADERADAMIMASYTHGAHRAKGLFLVTARLSPRTSVGDVAANHAPADAAEAPRPPPHDANQSPTESQPTSSPPTRARSAATATPC